MKPIRFLGDSLTRLREFDSDAKQDVGYQLDKVQRGEQPDDFKFMPSIGKGVEEIRICDESGTYRIIYTAMTFGCGICLTCIPKEDSSHGKTRY
jgi:phage-related protein